MDASLRRVLLVIAPLSAAGGIVGHGIYFLARERYGFDDRMDLWLAAALFLPYIPGALAAGPVGRRLGHRRAIQLVNLVSIACGLLLATTPPVWALWILAPLYNAACGMFWPLVEGYVAGGRRGADLHRAIGAFNLTWSAALAPALWVVALAGGSLLLTFGVLCALHVVVGLGVLGLSADPPVHEEESHVPPSPAYGALLRACRVLLPVSYMVLDALAPLLPGVWARAGIDAQWAPALSSVWMLARFAAFAVFTAWSGWRGRGAFLALGAVGLLGGFAAVMSAGAIPAVLAGLVMFGVGQGALYYASLYYGMAAGHDAVESGGRHEAVIGVGYLAGPAFALLGTAMGVAPAQLVGAAAAAGSLWAWQRGRSALGAQRSPHSR